MIDEIQINQNRNHEISKMHHTCEEIISKNGFFFYGKYIHIITKTLTLRDYL